jgi:cysteine desulfurase
MIKLPVYLDYQSTTPVDPEVFGAMQPYFTEVFGNAASRSHEYGWTAEAAVENSRSRVARAIGAHEKEIIFTSGATESDNLAILGAADAYRSKGNHIVTSPTEHKAVLDACEALRAKGFEISYAQPDSYGRILPESVEAVLRPETILVSVMAANNEIGTLNPIAAIGKLCKSRGVIFHSDAAQALGSVPIDVQELGVDLLSMSAHKIYGPKGVGALYVRRRGPRVKLSPIVHGGGHERGLRSGTLNVPGIVGLGKACEVAVRVMDTESARQRRLRDLLWDGIRGQLSEVYLNGHPTERLPGNLNVSFGHVDGDALMTGMKELAVSTGSACMSANLEPSYVLRAIGVSDDLVHNGVRFGVGRGTTEEQIAFAIGKIVATVRKLRELSPLYQGATL